MTKKEEFINWVEEIMKAAKTDWHEAPDNVQMYWEAFKGKNDSAEGLFVSSRTVSGAMLKLVTDGYVEKVGQEPVVYAITEKGKNITID